MIRLIVLVSLYLLSLNISSQTKKLKSQNHIVNKALSALKIDKELKNASIGFYAIDLKTEEVIAEYNSDLSMMPASTQKLVTTAVALEILGQKYHFKTKLQYSGQIDTISGVLKGNIYITGGSDPTLGSKYYDKEKKYSFVKNWVDAIKKKGINSITGEVIGDASRYSTEITPQKWAWEDIGNYYGSGANGLTVFDNLYEIHFKSSPLPDKLTKIISVEPKIPGLIINNEVLSSNIRSDQAFIFGGPYRYLHIIRGTIPKGKSNFVIKGAIPDPTLYMALKFNDELKKSGINTSGVTNTIRILELKGDTIKDKRYDLNTVYSPPIGSIVNITNKRSINLFAEHLLNEVGYIKKKEGSNSAGRKAITEFWKYKGMDTDGFHIYDGSGLSRSNSITAKQLVFILNYMKKKSKNFKVFYKSLPVAGKSGTLKSIGKNTSASGVVHAKSGSIGRVRAYSGYVNTKSGREFAFSMNIANYNCSSSKARKKLETLMIAMANFNL